MFAIAVHYLTGRVVAKRFDSHDDPEWPAHPARLFSSLVAALHAGGNQAEERLALEWLEMQAPPSLWFSDADVRSEHVTFVPVNDSNAQFEKKNKQGGTTVYQEMFQGSALRRLRNPRGFPSLTPREPRIFFIWPDVQPDARLIASIAAVAGRVSYLGHPSSLVSISIAGDPPTPRLLPSPNGQQVLRVVGPGQLQALENTFAAYASALKETKGSVPRLPLPTVFQRYAEPRPVNAQGLSAGAFGEIHTLRFPPGSSLGLSGTLMVTDAFRKAAMAHFRGNPPEILSGHSSDGSPSHQPHVAFIPLADTGHPYADGHLLGVAAVLPREVDSTARLSLLRAFAEINTLTLGRARAWPLASVGMNRRPQALDPRTWCGPSRRWATVTPVVLDRFPKELYSAQVEQIIAQACVRAGFSEPSEVIITPASPMPGVPLSRDFPPYAKVGYPRRFHTHAIVCFESAMQGPMLIGAGRYKGYGLCRPL